MPKVLSSLKETPFYIPEVIIRIIRIENGGETEGNRLGVKTKNPRSKATREQGKRSKKSKTKIKTRIGAVGPTLSMSMLARSCALSPSLRSMVEKCCVYSWTMNTKISYLRDVTLTSAERISKTGLEFVGCVWRANEGPGDAHRSFPLRVSTKRYSLSLITVEPNIERKKQEAGQQVSYLRAANCPRTTTMNAVMSSIFRRNSCE